MLNTLTKATGLGRCVIAAQRAHEDPVAAVPKHEGGIELFRGKVADVDRTTTGGFLGGHALVEGMDGYSCEYLRLDFQNEWAVAFRSGEAVA